MTMTSDIGAGEGREQRGFPAEISEGSCHYNKALVRLIYCQIPALYLIYVIHERKCVLSDLDNKTQVHSHVQIMC